MEDQSRYLESNINQEELIQLVPFMSDLPEDSIHKIAAHFVTISHPANQVLLLENDWGGSVYFILEGWVKIRTYNLDGKEVTLNILGRGEIFGEMAAMDKMPRSTDAITLTKTLIGRIPAEDFVNLINTEPTAGVRLVQLMAKRLRQVNRRLQLREASSISRVADAILFLVDGQGTRETVTRVLTKLEKKGLIQRTADSMRIPDLPALEDTIC